MSEEAHDFGRDTEIHESLNRIERSISFLATEQHEMHHLLEELTDRKLNSFQSHDGSAPFDVTHDQGVKNRISFATNLTKTRDSIHLAKEKKVMQASDNEEYVECRLDPTWPISLEIRPEFECSAPASAVSTRSSSNKLSMNALEGITYDAKRKDSFIIMPDSKRRAILDVIGTCVLAWDLVFTPLQVAWEVSISGWLLRILVFVTAFWTLDLLVNFRRGFYTRSGELETRPRRIAARYLRGQFQIDFLVVLIDWANIIENVFPKHFRLLRAFKLTRLVRVLRVINLIRFERIESLVDALGVGPVMLDSIRIIALTIWFTHIISCVWFMIGMKFTSDTGVNWVNTAMRENGPTYAEVYTVYQYCSALQWTLTTMLSGTSSIIPHNSLEQVFSCACIMLGLLGQAFVVSILSATAVEQKARERNLTVGISSLKTFCSQRRVNAGLWIVARSQVQASFIQRTHIPLEKVEEDSLQRIPLKIRIRILQEVFQPNLNRHALFILWGQLRQDAFSYGRMMGEVMDLTYVQNGFDIFVAGSQASHMYLISNGKADYFQYPASSKVDFETSSVVSLDTWLCEQALWIQWVHVGTMESMSNDTELHIVRVDGFLRILDDVTTKLRCVVIGYAAQYLKRVQESVPPHSFWPHDVETGGPNLLTSMTAEERKVATRLAFDSAQRIGLVDARQAAILNAEIMARKIDLLALVANGTHVSIQRVVSVARVIVRRDDSRFFVEIARFLNGQIIANIRFPGSKQQYPEDVYDTVARTVDTLKPTVGNLRPIRTETATELEVSTKLEITTQYSIFSAMFNLGDMRKDMRESMYSRSSPDMDTETRSVRFLPHGHSSLSKSRSFPSLISIRSSQHSRKLADCGNVFKERLLSKTELFSVKRSSGKTSICMWLSEDEMNFARSRKGMQFITEALETEELVASATVSTEFTDSSSITPDLETNFATSMISKIDLAV